MSLPDPLMLRTLMVDATLVEVVGALRAAQIESIVLKGPAMAQWLYAEDPSDRPYGDVDLFVGPQDWGATQAILQRLGFSELLGAESLRENEAATHADTWTRQTPHFGAIDLHRVPPQVTVSPEVAWATLREHRAPITVSGLSVDALSYEGRGLIAALHFTHHNGAEAKPREDLERAITALDDAGWRRAGQLAATLGCADEFSAGLHAVPEGAAVAGRIGLQPPPWFDEEFASGQRPRQKMKGAISLAEARGARAKAGVLLSELFPSPQFLRYQLPYARRSRLGLARAYAARPVALLRTSPAAVRQYRLTRRMLRSEDVAVRAARAERSGTMAVRNGQGARLARAFWAARATHAARTQLRSGPLEDVRIPAPRGIPNGLPGIPGVLRATRASCLERSLVRQAWAQAHGVEIDIVIGVTAPSEGFRAHAWLDGDGEDVSEFTEIMRHPPR